MTTWSSQSLRFKEVSKQIPLLLYLSCQPSLSPSFSARAVWTCVFIGLSHIEPIVLDGAHYMIYTPSDPLLFVAVKDKNGLLQIADDVSNFIWGMGFEFYFYKSKSNYHVES
ncbi:hypothetical protein TorRG33x02_358030 [Trema orientale]|uniref:Uncharacterized protein n=1 Tax=Trema orientale TaxID=63057 RepID=A0A2P5A457_TREOI|nr:hypothetical protein TorRG33x02_358030 [Trema orientale]